MRPILHLRCFCSRTTVIAAGVFLLAAAWNCPAQMNSAGGGPFGQARPGFPHLPSVRGTVKTLHASATNGSGSDAEIQTEQGVSYTIHCSDNTRIFKNRQPIQFAAIHVGDMLMAAGELDEKTHLLRAVFVGDIDAETVQKMRADLGKTWIAGRVTQIDMTTLHLTIDRIDHKSQVIAVDDTTSFKKSGQSVTLRDLHVGDMVRGKGTWKDGMFVPLELQMMNAVGDRGNGIPSPNGPIPPPTKP